MSNLLAFFQSGVNENEIPAGKVERLADMQVRVRRAVAEAESSLRRKSKPAPADIARWILGFADALDENLLAEILADLCPRSPAAALALKARAAGQLADLGQYVLARTDAPELRQRAEALVDWAEALRRRGDDRWKAS